LALKYRKGFLYPGSFQISEYGYALASPGSISLKETGKKILVKKTAIFRTPSSNFEIITPLSSLRFPLEIRNAARGDSYIKINSGINQSVFEMIRSSGFPADMRNYCPLILDARKKPIWVAGSPIAEPFRIKGQEETPFIKISYI
jgi:hypothetical protein